VTDRLLELCARVADPGGSAIALAGELGAYHADTQSPPVLYVEPFGDWLSAAVVGTRADGGVAFLRLEASEPLAVADLVSAFGAEGAPMRPTGAAGRLHFRWADCDVFADVNVDDTVRVLTLSP
jgi:hypothetical protein